MLLLFFFSCLGFDLSMILRKLLFLFLQNVVYDNIFSLLNQLAFLVISLNSYDFLIKKTQKCLFSCANQTFWTSQIPLQLVFKK